MEGRQAAFCGPVAPKKLPGGSDPDHTTRELEKAWEGQTPASVELDQALRLANALCKFPGNPELQSALMPRWTSFEKFYGLGPAELADVAAIQDPDRPTIERETRAPKDTRLSGADPMTQVAIVQQMLRGASRSSELMTYAELLDTTPNASEQLKVAFVRACVDSYHGSIAGWAICKADALGLDRKRFDAELAAAKIDPRHRLEAKLRFVKLQHAVKAKADQYAAEAAKDRGVAKVIEAIPAAAAKTWAAERAANQALLAWTYKLVDDARANNKRLMEGCEDTLRTHLASYLKGKAFETSRDLEYAFRDSIGSQLANAAALCFVRNDAARGFWSEWSTGFAQHWGLRTTIWHALASEKIEFDTDRTLGLPSPVIFYANTASSGSSGTIATAQDEGDKVRLTFKTSTWDETVCKQWKETNRIDSIKDGKLIYRKVCVKTAKEKRSSTAQPVTVDKAYSAGLRVGVAAAFVRNKDGSGYPIAIYDSPKRTRIIGAFGVLF